MWDLPFIINFDSKKISANQKNILIESQRTVKAVNFARLAAGYYKVKRVRGEGGSAQPVAKNCPIHCGIW
jgi:hypothetical protein